jgi:hypothetical protein
MALILSAATGNFNAGATWVGGIVPGAADEARASTTHVITITANVTCTELSNAGTGTYVLNSGVTLTANVTHKSTTTSVNCLTFSAASPATASIVGNCTAASAGSGGAVVQSGSGTLTITGNIIGGSVANSNCVLNSSTGTTNITGNLTAGAATNAGAVFNSSTATINIIGNVTASTSAGVTNNSTGSVTITGNVLAAAATGVTNASTGPFTITGNITAAAAAGVTNSSTATLTISGGTYTASTTANAVISTNASSVVRASGSFIYASNGFVPINTPKFILLTTPTLAKTRYALNGSTTYVDMFTADNSLGQAAITDVRFGTVYASGALTGVAYIPSASSVAFGVPVDNTTGTATLTAADVRAAIGLATANLDTQLAAIPTAITNANAVWDELMSNHTTAGTYGGRVVRATNANNELQINAQNHAAANVHQFQTAVIQSVAFATSAVTLFTGAMRTELTPELTEITEVHAIHGLDIANALTVTPTSRTSGAITQSITGDGTTNTVVTRV